MLLKPIDFKTKLMAYKVTTMFTQKFNRHENYFTAAAIEKTKSVGRSVGLVKKNKNRLYFDSMFHTLQSRW